MRLKFFMKKPAYRYDAFLSHAVEDKMPIANELYQRLTDAGLKIWYSGRELSVGDQLTATIEEGLAQCRFGIIIFSHHYVSKVWALREFFTLLLKDQQGRKVILPVLHEITPEELAEKHLNIAEFFALPTKGGIEPVVEKLVKEINRQHQEDRRLAVEKRVRNRRNLLSRVGFFLLFALFVVAALYGFRKLSYDGPDNEFIERAVEKRISLLNQIAKRDIVESFSNTNQGAKESINTTYANFKNYQSYYRNEYILETGYETIPTKKHVSATLGQDVELISPLNNYGFSDAIISIVAVDSLNSVYQFVYENNAPLSYEIREVHELPNEVFSIEVTYENNIRYVWTTLKFPSPMTNGMKKHQMRLYGMPPKETLLFTRTAGDWTYRVVAR